MAAEQQLGLVLVLAGEAMRKAAIVTAGHNFTHIVQVTRRARHALVTRGIYKHVRHPGYLGWLFWAVGTQLLLSNPLCTVVFAALVRLCLHVRRMMRLTTRAAH